MAKYTSTKTYTAAEGFSCCFRQWRAPRKSGRDKDIPYTPDEIGSCSVLHGYALSFHFEFECETLDERNWVVDFGGLKSLKEYLKHTFDHTVLVAIDDPAFEKFKELHDTGVIKMVVMDNVGCEAVAKHLYDYVNDEWLPENYGDREGLKCSNVEVRETPANMAKYGDY